MKTILKILLIILTSGVILSQNEKIPTLCGLKIPKYRKKFSNPIPVNSNLPEKFDWRSVGDIPVRNQGYCGSCWAFATIGAIEWSALANDNIMLDLSEQQLVDCDTSSNGCNGGYWAFDYIMDKGSISEQDYPYNALDGDCKTGFNSVFTVLEWGYVNPNRDIPTIEELKSALYQYGPLCIGISVDTAFQNYRSGIFSGNNSINVNHAVVLMGWDDSQQYWIIRNSWGSSWGESGYMRIYYNTAKLGTDAAYLVGRLSQESDLFVSFTEQKTTKIYIGKEIDFPFYIKNYGGDKQDIKIQITTDTPFLRVDPSDINLDMSAGTALKVEGVKLTCVEAVPYLREVKVYVNIDYGGKAFRYTSRIPVAYKIALFIDATADSYIEEFYRTWNTIKDLGISCVYTIIPNSKRFDYKMYDLVYIFGGDFSLYYEEDCFTKTVEYIKNGGKVIVDGNFSGLSYSIESWYQVYGISSLQGFSTLSKLDTNPPMRPMEIDLDTTPSLFKMYPRFSLFNGNNLAIGTYQGATTYKGCSMVGNSYILGRSLWSIYPSCGIKDDLNRENIVREEMRYVKILPPVGDINFDMKIDFKDLLLLSNYLCGNITTLPYPDGGDLDFNGKIDSVDYKILLSRVE